MQETTAARDRPRGRKAPLLVGAGVVIFAIAFLAGRILHRQQIGSRGPSPTHVQLKQLGLAMNHYENVHGRFPPAALYGKDGKPLLSWRILLLPYLEQEDLRGLYEQFNLEEPWDGPQNIQLLSKMPKVYGYIPGKAPKPQRNHTFFKVFVGKGTMFEDKEGVHFRDITDGTSHTIMIVEGGEAVPWTKPEDIPYAADEPLRRLATVRLGGFYAAMVDASVLFLTDNVTEAKIRALITRNGGERIDWDF
jgi:hypothetical protein